MGEAKLRMAHSFSKSIVQKFEDGDCLAFAIALARATGWLIHIDWWSQDGVSPSHDESGHAKIVRAYVADDKNHIFDVRGIYTVIDFNERIIKKLVSKKRFIDGGVLTRFYSENDALRIGLKNVVRDSDILAATNEISKNLKFLSLIPKRFPSALPAHEAAYFSWGSCAAFSEALSDLTGLKSFGLIAVKYAPNFKPEGYSPHWVHSLILHNDGTAEDSWGRSSISAIASRYGVIEFQLSASEHRDVVNKLKMESSDRFQMDYSRACFLMQDRKLA